jgi:putative membrane protein
MASERRLHPLSFLFALQTAAKQFLLPIIVALFAARGRDVWELSAAIVLLPLAVNALGRALSFRYRFEDTELIIRSGFIFRRVRHIPYDRIQNVDAVRNVLHRLLGVMEVRVETGGGTEAEAVLRVVDRDAMDEIRARVFAQRTRVAEPAGTTAASAPAPSVLLTMAPLEVFLFGLIHGRGTIVAGALSGLLWEFGLVDPAARAFFGEDTTGRGVIRRLALGVFDGAAPPLQQLFLSVAALFLLLVMFRIASALWTSVTYYGFMVTRSGDDLRCEYGLLTRVASTIPVRRIQKVTVREGPWHRLGRRVSVGVQTAGGKVEGGNESTRSWLAPLAHRSALAGLLSGILPEATADVNWQPVHPRGVRREFAGSMVFVLPASAVLASAVGPWALVPFAILTVWAYVHARRSVAALGWAVSSETVQFASGWLWQTRLAAPLAKIQVVSRHESPFDRRHGMASVFADTAGRAQGEYAIRIPYLAAPIAHELAGRLAADAARTSFRW